jgi:hypothetical protein
MREPTRENIGAYMREWVANEGELKGQQKGTWDKQGEYRMDEEEHRANKKNKKANKGEYGGERG